MTANFAPRSNHELYWNAVHGHEKGSGPDAVEVLFGVSPPDLSFGWVMVARVIW